MSNTYGHVFAFDRDICKRCGCTREWIVERDISCDEVLEGNVLIRFANGRVEFIGEPGGFFHPLSAMSESVPTMGVVESHTKEHRGLATPGDAKTNGSTCPVCGKFHEFRFDMKGKPLPVKCDHKVG